MNVAKWKDLAEIVALVAVVGSLLAVVYELRQTQSALQAEAYQARAFDGIEWNAVMAMDDELARIKDLVHSPEFDVTALSERERRKADLILTIIRIDLDNEHYQYESGFLDPGFYEGETREWIKVAAPVWRAFGQVEPRPEFRKEVDRILND